MACLSSQVDLNYKILIVYILSWLVSISLLQIVSNLSCLDGILPRARPTSGQPQGTIAPTTQRRWLL